MLISCCSDKLQCLPAYADAIKVFVTGHYISVGKLLWTHVAFFVLGMCWKYLCICKNRVCVCINKECPAAWAQFLYASDPCADKSPVDKLDFML